MTTFAEMSLAQRIDALTTAIRGHWQASYIFSIWHTMDLTVIDGVLWRVVLNVPTVSIAPVKTLLTMSDIEMYQTVMSIIGA